MASIMAASTLATFVALWLIIRQNA